MTTPNLRTILLANGYRVIAAAFDGSGDSGSLSGFYLPCPEDSTKSLTEILADDKELNMDLLFAGPQVMAKIKELLAPLKENTWDDPLDMLFYQILENFDGDWVNNAGGYGMAAVDLQTGEWTIQGYQRYEESSAANSEGLFKWDPMPTSTMTVSDLVKLTLNHKST